MMTLLGAGLVALALSIAWGVWYFVRETRESTAELRRANDAYQEIRGLGDAIAGAL